MLSELLPHLQWATIWNYIISYILYAHYLACYLSGLTGIHQTRDCQRWGMVGLQVLKVLFDNTACHGHSLLSLATKDAMKTTWLWFVHDDFSPYVTAWYSSVVCFSNSVNIVHRSWDVMPNKYAGRFCIITGRENTTRFIWIMLYYQRQYS